MVGSFYVNVQIFRLYSIPKIFFIGIRQMRKSKRPLAVTTIAVSVLIIAVVNLIRFIQAISQWDILTELLPIHLSPIYLVLSGLIWAVIGLILSYGLWHGKFWAPITTQIIFIVYLLYYWLDRLFLSNPISKLTNLRFAIVSSLLLLVWVFWLFSRSDIKYYFGETNE